MLTLSYTINYSSFCSLAGIINNLISPYGYQPYHAGILGGGGIIFGIITSFALSVLVDRTKKYLLIYRVMSVCCIVATVLYYYTLKPDNFAIILINSIIWVGLTLPFNAVCLGFSVELAYPVSEVMANSVMIILSQVLSMILTYAGSILADKSPLYVVTLYTFLFLISNTINIFIKEDLRRLKLENIVSDEALMQKVPLEFEENGDNRNLDEFH